MNTVHELLFLCGNDMTHEYRKILVTFFYASFPIQNKICSQLIWPAVCMVWVMSALSEHAATSNHGIDWDSVKVLEQEQNCRLPSIKKAIHIHTSPHSLNTPHGMSHITSRCLGLPPEPTTSAGTMAPLTSQEPRESRVMGGPTNSPGMSHNVILW